MPRKPMYNEGTKNKMIEVASKRFFQYGFDGTSIRSIVDEVGCEVGLFYYYYKTKDDIFTDVLESFFEPYKKDFQMLVTETKSRPNKALYMFFSYMKEKVREFREKYADNIHRTVRWAIREQTLTVIEPYLKEIIDILISYGAKPKMDSKLMSVFLSHGVGSIILHEDIDWVESVTDEVRRNINIIMGLDEKTSEKMFSESEK